MSTATVTHNQTASNVTPSRSIVDLLDSDQQAALVLKAAMLPEEVQANMKALAPNLSPVEQYLLRQARKEANSALASKLRPGWIMLLALYAPTLTSKDELVRKDAEKRISAINDEIPDIKESIKVLKAVKGRLLMKSTNPTDTTNAIEQACKIFSVKPETLLQ